MSKFRPTLKLSAAVSILVLLAAFLSPGQVSSQGSGAYEVRYTAEFSSAALSLDKFLGYDVVGLEGAFYLDELGTPMLPAIQLQMAVPEGMTANSVRVVNASREEISGEFGVLPIQPPRKIGHGDEDMVFVEPDPEIYASNRPYPSKLAEFVQQGDLAGQGIATVQLYPVQYVPAEKKLILYTSISFVIEGVGGHECSNYLSPNISERGRRAYEQMIKGMVVNPQEVRLRTGWTTKSSMLSDGSFDHVLITGPLHAAWYEQLILWHNQKGLRDTVVNIDWIYANYSGSTEQQKIRNFVIDANTNWGTIYFLMGGEHETVPFYYRSYIGEVTASDQYYSDFNDDWIHDVFVGRVSAESSFEIQTFVFKLLGYEKNPPRTDYALNVMLQGMDLDDFTEAEELKDTVELTAPIPPRFNVTKVYDSDATPPSHKTKFIDALNAGQNLVNHADHSNIWSMGMGWENHYWDISTTDVDNLTNNNKMCIMYTLGCLTNYMDTTSDCIGEHFVIYNPNRAAVAFLGNTRDGLYQSSRPVSRSGLLDKEWWISLFTRDKVNLGQTVADAKNHFPNSVNGDRHCEWTLNLLGEPAMPVWTDDPDSFAVTCPSTLPKGKIAFPVHVEDSTTHEPVDSAYVCVWKAGEVFETGYTDANGDIDLNPAPTTVGSLWVTVTKHNYIPHQQVITMDYVCGDITGDGIVDVGDVVYLICYLYRGCPAPDPVEAADCNADDVVNVADIVCLINYLYRDGYPPGSPP
jgi:hypothetical protein